MARIELLPVLAGSHALDDPEEDACLVQRVIDADAAIKRLSPVMKALVEKNDLEFYASALTSTNVDDLIVTLEPFMDMPEDEIRYTLSHASFAEWFDAFIRVGPLGEHCPKHVDVG